MIARSISIAATAKRIALGAAAVLAAAMPAAAPAQLARGYSGHAGVRYMGDEEIWWSIRQLGDCLARNRRSAAIALLGTQPGTDAEAAAARALLGSNTSCLQPNARMSVGRDVIRAAVAEGLYRRNYSSPPPAVALDDGAEADAPPAPLLVEFARCFVQVRPEAVHELLVTTRLGTRDEHAAFARLAPDLGQCLPAGTTVDLVAPFVRLALAEALYQRARQLQPVQAGRR